MRRTALILAMLFLWSSGGPASAAPVADRPQAMTVDGPEPAALTGPAAVPGEETPQPPSAATVCDLIEEAAARHGLPVTFFTRLIWKESRFRALAVSPKGAQGIAQFMPATAAERGLGDPFDPHQAIPASARFVGELWARFGNIGLAAAAYNAGPARVAAWLAGASGLPWETRDYVAAITGRPVEHWSTADGPDPDKADEPAAVRRSQTCTEIAAQLATPAALQAVPPSQAGAGPGWQPWGVQVAGNFSEARALAAFRGLQRLYPSILGGREPIILRKRNLSLGTRPMVNVRIPVPSRAEADALCRRLRSKGGACIVLRN